MQAGKVLVASVDLSRNGRILTRILRLHPDTDSVGEDDCREREGEERGRENGEEG